ncbi:MAG: dephospho-CoA kinase [Pseudomonadota bacterium]
MTVLLGLTGSIGMGKSTAARLFQAEGCPVWDADACVHRLYGPAAPGTDRIRVLAPTAVTDAGVDRSALRDLIAEEPTLLKDIETAIHPLVAADRAAFIAQHSDPCLVFEIPLLYETNAQAALTAVAVVSTFPEVQRDRVLARPGMTEETLKMITAKQMSDAEKRARADYIIDSTTMNTATADVKRILADLLKGSTHA